MSNYPTPAGDSAISGLFPIEVPLTVADLLIISVKLTEGYYTGRISLAQIKAFFLNNTTALEIAGLATLLDGKANTSHKHLAADITDLPILMAGKANLSHTHNANQVLGLTSLLDDKANTVHAHEMSAVNGLISTLAGKAAFSHVHEITDVLGLKARLDNLDAWTSSGGSNHTHQIEQIIGLQLILNNKAEVVHSHSLADISGLVLLLDNKTEVGHSHTVSDITDFQSSLDSKADSIHQHDVENIRGLENALEEKANTIHEHSIDDVALLRTTLDDKAPKVHNHNAAAIDGLGLLLGTKSDADHVHQITGIEGLDDVLAEKTSFGHKHNTADLDDFSTEMAKKANTIHQHTINDVEGLTNQLNGAEKISNRVNTFDNSNPGNYPTVDAVRNGVIDMLTRYVFPVMSVNGMFGEVSVNKTTVGLGAVDNTSDKDKPVSNDTQAALALKVNNKLSGFKENRSVGRIINGDDYVTVLEKIQWQLDIARGLVEEPELNPVTFTKDGHSLLLSFARPVLYLGTALTALSSSINLFQSVISSDLLSDIGGVVYDNIETSVTETSVEFVLKPGWIRVQNMALVNSTDNGGNGTGIIEGVAAIAMNFFSSVDGGILSPRLTEPTDLTLYTNLSEQATVHDDVEYAKAETLGVWSTAPVYDYQPPQTILDVEIADNRLTLTFNNSVLFNGAGLMLWVGDAIETIRAVFVEHLDLTTMIDAMLLNKVEMTIAEKSIEFVLQPGFFDKTIFEMLDSPEGGMGGNGDGIQQVLATIDVTKFTPLDGTDLTLTGTAELTLSAYTNMSNYTPLHTAEDYANATIIGSWADELSFADVPPIAATGLTGGWDVN